MNIREFSRKIYILEAVVYVFITIINMAAFNLEISFKLTNISNNLTIALIVILFLEFLLNISVFKVTKKTIIFLLISIPIMLMSIVYSGRGLLLTYLFVLAYPQNLKSEDLGKWIFRTLIASVLLIILLCMNGIASNITSVRSNGALRQSFGFTTPNALGNIITLIFWLKVFISWKTWHKKDTFLWAIIILMTYNITNSRMSFYLSIVVLLSIMLYKSGWLHNIFDKAIYKFPFILFIINSIVTFFLVSYFKTHTNIIFDVVNKISSGRLTYMLSFIDTYGVSIFGNRSIQFISANQVRNSNNYLRWAGIDNSYMYIAILYGMVILISFALIYYFTEKYMERTHNFGGALYLTVYVVMSLTENYMVNIAINFLFFMFAEYLMKTDEKYE